MSKMHISYNGDLRNTATHFSGVSIQTDAPLDNEGKGEAFSPTDLLCVSLATCIITTMAIAARKKNIPFDTAEAEVEKKMSLQPRKVAIIRVEIKMPAHLNGHPEKDYLESIGHSCPVSLSLHPDVRQEITFRYE